MGIDNVAREYLEKRLEIAGREMAGMQGEITGSELTPREQQAFWKGASAAIDFLEVLNNETTTTVERVK